MKALSLLGLFSLVATGSALVVLSFDHAQFPRGNDDTIIVRDRGNDDTITVRNVRCVNGEFVPVSELPADFVPTIAKPVIAADGSVSFPGSCS